MVCMTSQYYVRIIPCAMGMGKKRGQKLFQMTGFARCSFFKKMGKNIASSYFDMA